MTTLFHVVLDCCHPLCSRGLESTRRARVKVLSAPAPDAAAFAAARALYADARDRRCRACHRPIALQRLALIELDRDLCEVQRYNGPNRPGWADLALDVAACQ